MSLRVAITGGSGRVGQHIVKALAERGHSVINMDRRPSKDSPAKFAFVDIRRRDQVQPILEQVDAVIHTAEIPNHHQPYSYDEIFAHNTSGTAVIIQTAADLKLKRAIYTSSCQAYGVWGDPVVPPLTLPMDETAPLRPQNVYGLAKQVNEMFCDFVSRTTGLSIAIMRLPGVSTLFGDYIFRWMEHRAERVDDLATFVNVKDVGEAYALAIEKQIPGCEAYNLAATEVGSLTPLRERLEKFNPEFPKLPSDWPDFKCPLLIDKAREHFGWEPKSNPRQEYFKWKESQKK